MSDDPPNDRRAHGLGPLPRAQDLVDGLEGRLINAKLRARMFGSTTDVPKIGPYHVQNKIGEGGVGAVYRCMHAQTGAVAAVKVLHDETASAATRLRREARAMAQLQHPNVVGIYEIDTCDEGVFIAMEFVAGTNMRTWLEEERPHHEVALVVMQTATGLAAAHTQGFVHRDIKPDNVLVDVHGNARITDFGLVKALPDSAPQSLSTFGRPLTATGAVLGTLGYMAPEQLRGNEITPAVDQFSLAATAFEAIYGHRPFQGPTSDAVALAILRGHIEQPVPPLAPLHPVLHRAMSVNPEKRFESIIGFAEALMNALEVSASSKR